jgi:tetratricopeptide (TPR) repeat protein
MIADALEEQDVWDTREVPEGPVPATIAALRSFADRMSLEDSQAETILRELLAGPREEWMPRLRLHPEWRTAGVVRKLIEGIPTAVTTMPPNALEMTSLSTEIADHLDPTIFASDTVMRLRGSVWYDRAYSLFYVGQFTESLAAADRADLNLQACLVDEYDLARVDIVRALALRAKEDLSRAMVAIRASGDTFVRFGDLTRLASARLAETHLLFTRGEFEAARQILEELDAQLSRTGDANIHARVLGNLGYCFWKLGRIEEALSHHEAAAGILDDLGVETEAARVRWNVASILVTAGRVDDAQARLEALEKVFGRLGMTSEVALVRLDVAELLIAKDDFHAVEEICRTAMESLVKAGIPYTARALTALAYMREAAQHRTATPALVKHVREYIRRLPQERELLFAPPPPDGHLPSSR